MSRQPNLAPAAFPEMWTASSMRNSARSLDELDRHRFAAQTLRAGITQAEAAIKVSETEIARSRVTAPIDGEILKLNVRAGEFAAAGVAPEPLLLLGNIAPLHLRVDVDEQDAWRVASSAKAVATVRGNPSLQTALEFVRFDHVRCAETLPDRGQH